MAIKDNQLFVPRDEIDYLRESMRTVRGWLTMLSAEDLDPHTLGTLHACISALSTNNPRLAVAAAISSEIDKWAQLLVDYVEKDEAPMVYAAVLRRSADLIEARKVASKTGGYRGPTQIV